MGVNLKSIAEASNVAEATVSRILRNRDTCSRETRERVLEAARQLKYRPNMLVRGMQTGRTQTIGIVVPNMRFPMTFTFEAMHDALVERDMVPYVLCTGGKRSDSDDSPATELKQIHRLIDRRVDGVIITPAAFALYDKSLREIWERNLPMVMLFAQLDVPKADYVGVDDVYGGRLVAQHLLDMGHRNIAMIASNAESCADRRRSFRSTLESHGFEPVVFDAPDDYHAGEAPRLLLDMPCEDRPTAVFCETDFIAENLCDEVLARGLRMPQDMAVIGYNDLPLARIRRPQISSVALPFEAIGRTAVEMLLRRLDGDSKIGDKQIAQIKPELKVRASTSGSQHNSLSTSTTII